MHLWNHICSSMVENWPVWLVSGVLIGAAVIDGWKLKVPNWITFPFVISGWIYSTAFFGWEGLGWSLIGTAVGLAPFVAALCYWRHGGWRRKTFSRSWRVGLGYRHILCFLSLCIDRRSNRCGNGYVEW